MASARCRNTASARELSKCLKANLAALDEFMLNPDLPVVCERLESLMEDMLNLTLRPTESSLTEAMLLAYDNLSKQTCKPYAQAIVNCTQFVRGKVHSCSSGKKLPPAVSRLVRKMRMLMNKPVSTPRRTSAELPLAASPSVSPPAKPSARTVSQSKAAVYAAYGVAPSPDKGAAVQEISSEEEDARLVLTQGASSAAAEPSEPRVPEAASSAGGSSEVAPEQTREAAARPPPGAYFDPSQETYVSVDGNVAGPLEKGPCGFCLCAFPGGQPFTTEVANLWLQPVAQKRPAARAPKLGASKKPRQEVSAETEEAEVVAAVEAEQGETVEGTRCYLKMFYSKTGKAALRQGYGAKRQVFQFGSSAYTRDRLFEILDKNIIPKLIEGTLKEDAARATAEALL
jgi:hypothetical protein